MIIPSDVVCSYCKRIFCCSKCRLTHQEKMHVNEIENQNSVPEVPKNCYICKGQQYPLKPEESIEVFQHIVEHHLPLKCNKCFKVFSCSDDFQDFGICSKEKTECNLVESGTSEGKEKSFKVPVKVCDEKVSSSVANDSDESSLTPLTKINLRWRRKSKGFEPSAVLDSASVSEQEEPKVISTKPLSRQTSTPMPKCAPILSSDPSYSASSIQISSINCTSSTSSESDSCASPPVQPAATKKVINTPMIKKPGPIAPKSRPRMPVQATPLRQIMSKSIQRALAQHGYNRPGNYNGLQQRKVCFDSTGSSNESSNSNSTCSGYPLDLRTSPVIRRTQSDSSSLEIYKRAIEAKKSSIKLQSNFMESSKAAQEELPKSQKSSAEGSMSSHYFSSQSLVPTKSENLIEETPKTNSNPGLLKKTISFELTPSKEVTMFQTACGDEDDDDVFFTPCGTPSRSYSCSALELKKIQVQETPSSSKVMKENLEKPGKSSDIWSLVTSVMRVTAKKPDKSLKEEKQQENHSKSFNFSKVGLVQKAASFAGFLRSFRHDDSTSSDPPSAKRRRLVSDLNVTSPLKKKQRIQGRKPIDRMRNS